MDCETSRRLNTALTRIDDLELDIETLQQQMTVIYTHVGGIVSKLQKGEII